MFNYDVHFQIPGSGAGVIHEIVSASSEYQARRIIEAKYGRDKVQILNCRRVG